MKNKKLKKFIYKNKGYFCTVFFLTYLNIFGLLIGIIEDNWLISIFMGAVTIIMLSPLLIPKDFNTWGE